MCDLVFYDPLAHGESSGTEGNNVSEAVAPDTGNGSRKWRRSPKRRQHAKNLVVQDLQLLASQTGYRSADPNLPWDCATE
jgi:hypothetical protein